MTGPDQFVAQVTDAFPPLRPVLARSAGNFHHQVNDFAAFTQDAKEQGDWPIYERCVLLADQFLASGSPDVAAAIRTEFVSHLAFEGSRGPAAWQLLPVALQAAWKQMDAENRRLMALPQTEKQGSTPERRRERHRQPRVPKPKGPGGGAAMGPKNPKGRRRRRGRGGHGR